MFARSTFGTLALMTSLIAIGAGIGVYSARQQQASVPPAVPGLMWPSPKVLAPFQMLDHKGRQFGLEQLNGNWSLLFFGYTNCPDICPITLSLLNQMHERMRAEDMDTKTQIVFVSVDPDRDSVDQLDSYVSYFNEDFFGLGGSMEQLHSLTGQMGIAYYHQEATGQGDYLVDHSASVFLISPAGEMIAVFSAPHQLEDMLQRFSLIRSFYHDQDTA